MKIIKLFLAILLMAISANKAMEQFNSQKNLKKYKSTQNLCKSKSLADLSQRYTEKDLDDMWSSEGDLTPPTARRQPSPHTDNNLISYWENALKDHQSNP